MRPQNQMSDDPAHEANHPLHQRFVGKTRLFEIDRLHNIMEQHHRAHAKEAEQRWRQQTQRRRDFAVAKAGKLNIKEYHIRLGLLHGAEDAPTVRDPIEAPSGNKVQPCAVFFGALRIRFGLIIFPWRQLIDQQVEIGHFRFFAKGTHKMISIFI